MELLARTGLAFYFLVAGLLTSVSLVALHSRWWGMSLGLAATAAMLVATPRVWWGRPAFCLGWIVIVAVVMTGRPEGDFVLASDTSGYLVLVSAFVVIVWGLVTIPRRAEPPA